MQKVIKYYVRELYGTKREFFIDKAESSVFQQLTGRKTLDSVSRELLRDISGGVIQFQQVLPPN